MKELPHIALVNHTGNNATTRDHLSTYKNTKIAEILFIFITKNINCIQMIIIYTAKTLK